MSKRLLILMCSIFLIVPLLFMGCGSDGSDGAKGDKGDIGDPGPGGEDVTANPMPESCNVCHGVGTVQEVRVVHAPTGVPSFTSDNGVIDGAGNLVVSFNIKVDGVNSDAFTPLYRAYAYFDNAALDNGANTVPVLTTGQRNTIASSVTLTNTPGTGNYTATVPAANVIDNATYLIILTTGGQGHGEPGVLEVDVIVNNGASPRRDLVTNTGCASCHGPYPARSKNFPHYAVGGSECQICHSIFSRTMEARTLNAGDTIDSITTARGTNLPEYIHGIHNSHNMPGGQYFRSTPATGQDPQDLNTEERYSVGYPSDMRNCNVCHETTAQQETIAAAPVAYFLCMSCHQSWDGFSNIPAAGTGGLSFHRSYGPGQDCMFACHVNLPEKNEVADFHDFFAADSHFDSFYRGEDISYNNPDNVLFAITGITKSVDNVTFTWTATKDNTAVNPCNDNLSTGPTFRDLGAYLAYAKGDDWVNDNVAGQSGPGQPLGSRGLFVGTPTNPPLSTTCDNTLKATTTGLVVAQGPKAYATKAVLAIGGKPLNRGTFTIGAASVARDYGVRVPSPTRAFSMADGSAVPARRNAVTTDKCNRCHRGTLYQHGGDRVDNEQLCVICHNPSASEKNVRVNTFQILNSDNTVNTNATYDGKTAETYDMRYLLHAVHGAEKREKPIVIYRSRGIFAFAQPLYRVEGNDRISIEHPRPTGWPADETTRQPVNGSLNAGTQTHTWTTIHYPKPANDCFACHNGDGDQFSAPADQTKAVALTVDPGTSFSLQNDDLVIGPTAAACTGCHESTGPDGIPVQRHVTFDFGYKAVVAKEVMLEKAEAVALGPDITP